MNVCYKCDKDFKNSADLKRHLNRIKPCNIKTEYKCDICLYCFNTNYSLTRHKNKKIKCKPAIIKLQEENKLLKIENQNIINTSNVHNTNNNTNNNNSHNTNNILNMNIILAHEDIKNRVITQSYPLSEIKNILNSDRIQEFLELATVDKDHDEDDVLQNTKDIGILLKYVFCNINLQKNFIFFKDFVEDQIYVKLNSEIKKLTFNDIIYIIFIVFEELLKLDNLDEELEKFYKRYIKKYNNQEFMELDTKEIKNFVRKIRDDLNISLIDLYENLKLFKSGNFKKLNEKDIQYKEKLIENKKNRHNKLLEENKTLFVKDNTKSLIETLEKLFKDDNNYDDEYIININEKKFYYEDIKYIKLLSYFINKFYINNKRSKIKYEKASFYYYMGIINNEITWEKKDLYALYNCFINELLDYLNRYKILIDNEAIKEKCNIDRDNDYYDFTENLIDKPYRFILKYMIINNLSEINLNKKKINTELEVYKN